MHRMTQYPGVIRTFVSYISESLTVTLRIMIVMGLICSPVLLLFGLVDGEFFGYALFAYLGLCVYLGQLDVGGSLATVNDATESNTIAGILKVVMVFYYNVVIFVSSFIAVALAYNGISTFALSVAILYPIYDAEMARDPLPISIAGGTVSAFLLIAWVVEKSQKELQIEIDHDFAEQIRDLTTTKSILRDYLISEIERKRGDRISS